MPDVTATVLLIVVLSTPLHDPPSRYHQDLASAARCDNERRAVEADMARWHYVGHASCVAPSQIGD